MGASMSHNEIEVQIITSILEKQSKTIIREKEKNNIWWLAKAQR